MLREQLIAFLEATIIFLLITNAISVCAAAWAVWQTTRTHPNRRQRVVMAEAIISVGLAFAIANAIGGVAGKPHPPEIHAAGFVRSAGR